MIDRVTAALSALAVVVSAVSFPACKKGDAAKGDPKTASTHVRVQLNWVPEPEFGGIYEARDDGAYTRAGLDVEILSGGPGSPVVQLVAGGKSDFGVAGADDVVVARARGVDIVAVFGTFQINPQGIMVHAAKNVTSLADLKSA